MYEKPKQLDLFSGIGGFSIAGERHGFQTIGFSEIDPYASAVLKRHWPNIINYGDIRNIRGSEVGHVDLITGGFPCQPFSSSGKRNGDSDKRFLWPELLRVVGEVRPRFTLFENVPGLLSIDGGRTFNRILSDISSIGYDCLWNLVPACAIGANHQRDRIWIVAYSGHDARGAKLELKREASAKEPPGVCSTNVADSKGHESKSELGGLRRNLESNCSTKGEQGWWTIEPNMGRVANGIPNRSHRLRCLGNGIVPQVAEIFLKEISALL